MDRVDRYWRRQYLFDRSEQVGSRILGSSASGGLDSDIIRQVAIDRDGTFWFATPVGLFRYRNWAWIRTDDRSDGLNVTDLLVDRQGALWVATGEEGVLRKSSVYAQGVSYLPGETALPSEQVNRLEEDPTGGIWAATDMGVARFVDGQWDRPVANVDLPSSVVRSLKSDAHGLWIGTAAGLARYTFADHVVDEIPQLHGHQIDHLAYDMLGNLWVTGSHGEIWQYQGDDIWLDLAAAGRGMPGGATVTALLPDVKTPGGMLVALPGVGILRWNGQEWARLSKSPRLIDERVFALMVDRADGSLWIGSETGLSREDDLSWTTYDTTDGIQNGAIHAIVSDPRGGYWFGGQKGLSYYRAEHTQPWIALVEPVSAGAAQGGADLQAYIGRPIAFRVDVGDIQTPREKLQPFYREIGPAGVGDWTELAAGSFSRKFPQTGEYQVEFMVRDQAFNYSKLLVQRLNVAPLPSMIALPFVGDIDVRVGSLLAVFGGFAFIGLGYVGFEVVARRIRAMAMVRRGFNPYISGEPVRQENMFFGREDMLQRIVATLHNNSIMIHGERRIGKTTLLYQLANVLRHVDDHEYWFLPVFIDLEGTTGARLFHLLIEDIAQEILALPSLVATDQGRVQTLLQQSLSQADYTDREFARDLRTVIRILEQYSTDRKDGRHARLILLMDEMDTLSKFDHLYQQQLRRIFMRDFAATVGAVVAGIEISKDWDRVESPWYNLFNEIAMQLFTRDQAVELLTKPVRGCYVFAPDALEFIIAQCEGRPYRLQQYALQAVNHMIKYRRRRITLIDALAADTEIQAAYNATDARAGLSSESPVQQPIKEYTERMLSPT